MSSFDRRSTVSTHHDLWIELQRIEQAMEQSRNQCNTGGDSATTQLKERQLYLREALAQLGH